MGELVGGGKDGKTGKMNRWKKGESGNPKGRPKTLIKKLTKKGKLSNSQAKELIQIALNSSVADLKEVFQNDEMMIYFRIIAGDIAECLKTKNFKRLESMLERAFGKSVQPVEDVTPRNISFVIEGDEVENPMPETEDFGDMKKPEHAKKTSKKNAEKGEHEEN